MTGRTESRNQAFVTIGAWFKGECQHCSLRAWFANFYKGRSSAKKVCQRKYLGNRAYRKNKYLEDCLAANPGTAVALRWGWSECDRWKWPRGSTLSCFWTRPTGPRGEMDIPSCIPTGVCSSVPGTDRPLHIIELVSTPYLRPQGSSSLHLRLANSVTRLWSQKSIVSSCRMSNGQALRLSRIFTNRGSEASPRINMWILWFQWHRVCTWRAYASLVRCTDEKSALLEDWKDWANPVDRLL